MKSITVRNIPDEILEAVRILSIKERRSLNNELIVIMENGLNSIHSSSSLKTELKEDPWKKLAGKWKDKRSTAKIIDDIYSSRTIGRDIKL